MEAMRRSVLSLLCALSVTCAAWVMPSARAQGGAPLPAEVAASVRRTIEKVGRDLGHTSLVADPRLEAAANALAQHARECGPPSRELVEEAMWQSGVVEPVHRLMLVRFAPESPDGMLAELPARLPQFFGKRGQSGGSGG